MVRWSIWRCLIATQASRVRRRKTEAKPVEQTPAEAKRDQQDEQKLQTRLATARHFAVEAAKLALATRCNNVVVLDVSAISPITDFFVIATGTSPRQMRTVCDEIEELGRPGGFKALSKPGYEGDQWILVDFLDVVVHLFNHDARAFYDLDNLWGDGKTIEWRETAPVVQK